MPSCSRGTIQGRKVAFQGIPTVWVCYTSLTCYTRLTVSKALVRSMKTTCRGRECSTLFWSCLSENTMFDVLLDKRDESHVDSQVEFCQQSDGLWARGDEQNLSRQYTKARCHNSCCNPYDRPYSYREWWCWCLWNRPGDIVYSSISWICGKAPLAEVCHHFSKSRGGCHLAQEISCSWDLWSWDLWLKILHCYHTSGAKLAASRLCLLPGDRNSTHCVSFTFAWG